MKNLNKKTLLIAVIALALIVGGVAFALKNSGTGPVLAVEQAVTETPAESAQTATEVAVEAAAPQAAPETAPALTYDNATLPSDPLGERSLGDPNAPVKIEEFASLTCNHCAAFHSTTFPELKRNYIDTGKVFFTFTDFPLNAPALDATMVARCLPPERYFTFLSFLFETQAQWAFSQDYRNNLRQNAKLAGMTDERFDQCLADTALKDGIVARMQQKGLTHAVSSTPSFVVNGTVLTGALPLAAFDKAIAEAQAMPVPAPTTEPVQPATGQE